MGSLISYNGERIEAARRKLDVGYYDYALRFLKSGVPLDYIINLTNEEVKEKKAYLYDLETEKANRRGFKIYEKYITRYIQSLENRDKVYQRGISLLFSGYNSSGKTHTANNILMRAIDSGLSGYYIEIKELYSLYNDAVFNRDEDAMEVKNHIFSCDVLVVDELGKESTTENFLGFLEQLIKERSSQNLCTIFCTNLDMVKREATLRYGESVRAIMTEKYTAFIFAKEGQFRAKRREEW